MYDSRDKEVVGYRFAGGLPDSGTLPAGAYTSQQRAINRRRRPHHSKIEHSSWNDRCSGIYSCPIQNEHNDHIDPVIGWS